MKSQFWNNNSVAANADAATFIKRGRTDADFDEAKYKGASIPSTTASPARSSAGVDSGPNANIQAINEAVRSSSAWVAPLRQEIGRVIVGQQHLVDRLIVGLITNGHILLEGVPGLAKTLAVKTLAAATQVKFQRLQFTPDMLPADIVGTMIYNPRDGSFSTKHGPIFANLILADEINRAPAKVQSALLEAMQERQVTLGDETYRLPDPFLVLATENPLEQEGTYPLPEAQVDRFMLKVLMDYPNRSEEIAILEAMATSEPSWEIHPVVSGEDIIRARCVVNTIYVDEKVKHYIVDLVLATRDPRAYGIDLNGYVQCGGSPRATINLTLAARASAFLQGRGYVTPQDVKDMVFDVMRHRVAVSYEAEAENITSEHVIQKILDGLPVP
ncbi:MAG TPA: MoxR family ATPase [Tepidisphaeraceae bacterium]|jgi:MoxR-like ATPase|nr:MoxR family ATPase [Tepidisphaeraceae bacterium]